MKSKPNVTEIELYIIQKVREKRTELGIPMSSLSSSIGRADSFISMVESDKYGTKYNINHLNAIAKVFKCSPKDFFPDTPL